MHKGTTIASQTQDSSGSTVPKGNIADTPAEAYNPVKGEMALWAAVITQALMDAGSKSAKPEAQHEKAKAIRWLLGNSEDFVTVCQNAGFDPLYVRDRAQKAIQRGCVWRRAEAGKSCASSLPARPLPARIEKKHHIPTAPANQPVPLHYRPRPLICQSHPARPPIGMSYYPGTPFHAPSPAYGNC